MSISYRVGDALFPVGIDNKIIVHICNNRGAWGGGFTKPLTKRWKEPEIAYRKLKVRILGSVELVQVESNIKVANVIGQVLHDYNGPRIRYYAVSKALTIIAEISKSENCSIHMPRIGCGLAGGKWKEIERIILSTLVKSGIHVNVYDLVK